MQYNGYRQHHARPADTDGQRVQLVTSRLRNNVRPQARTYAVQHLCISNARASPEYKHPLSMLSHLSD